MYGRPMKSHKISLICDSFEQLCEKCKPFLRKTRGPLPTLYIELEQFERMKEYTLFLRLCESLRKSPELTQIISREDYTQYRAHTINVLKSIIFTWDDYVLEQDGTVRKDFSSRIRGAVRMYLVDHVDSTCQYVNNYNMYLV